MKILLRDIILVIATCGLCLGAVYTARWLLDRKEQQEQVDRLLRRLQRDKEAREKMRREIECKECRRA